MYKIISKRSMAHSLTAGGILTVYTYYMDGNPLKKSLYTGLSLTASVVLVDKLLEFLFDGRDVESVDFSQLKDV